MNLIFLHGLLGWGKNLWSLASGFLDYGDAYLVDLRNHGNSFHSSSNLISDHVEDIK